jgi:hypothetical protein
VFRGQTLCRISPPPAVKWLVSGTAWHELVWIDSPFGSFSRLRYKVLDKENAAVWDRQHSAQIGYGAAGGGESSIVNGCINEEIGYEMEGHRNLDLPHRALESVGCR